MLLVLQVAAAITGLTLGFCRSKEIADDTLNAFMHSYEYDTSLRESMDWMQLKVKIFYFIVEIFCARYNSTSTNVVEIKDRTIGLISQ